jgi:hypothetical protein
MKRFALLLLVLITGCGIDLDPRHFFENTEIDAALRPYVEDFMEQCVARKGATFCKNRMAIVKYVKATSDYRDLIGFGDCRTDNLNYYWKKVKYRQRIRVLTHNFWGEPHAPNQIRQVVFHEFGHCFFGLEHDETPLMGTDLLPAGVSPSRMIREFWEYVR